MEVWFRHYKEVSQYSTCHSLMLLFIGLLLFLGFDFYLPETEQTDRHRETEIGRETERDRLTDSFSFSSRWHRSARKGPYALRPVS